MELARQHMYPAAVGVNGTLVPLIAHWAMPSQDNNNPARDNPIWWDNTGNMANKW
jgi:hypothetical protein